MAASVDDWRATAHHEAGHAVMAHRLGVAFRVVTLEPGHASLGQVVIESLLPRLDGLELGFATPDEVSARTRRRIEHHLMVACAGWTAELRYGGIGGSWHGPEHDEPAMHRMLDLISKSRAERVHFLAWLRARSTTLIDGGLLWAQVESVAGALMERGTLTRRDVSESVAAGIDAWEQARLRPTTRPIIP